MFNLNWLGTCSYPVHWLVVTGVRACQKLRSLKMFTFFSHGCRLILMGTDSFSPLAILSQSSRFDPWFTRVTRLLFYMKKNPAMIRTDPEQSMECQIDLIWKSEDFCPWTLMQSPSYTCHLLSQNERLPQRDVSMEISDIRCSFLDSKHFWNL